MGLSVWRWDMFLTCVDGDPLEIKLKFQKCY